MPHSRNLRKPFKISFLKYQLMICGNAPGQKAAGLRLPDMKKPLGEPKGCPGDAEERDGRQSPPPKAMAPPNPSSRVS